MKKIPRIYLNQNLNVNQKIILRNEKKNYIKKVMRMKVRDKIYIFNNTNFLFYSEIFELNKKQVILFIIKKKKKNRESSLKINLGQSISKKKSMSWIVQKSSELGVNSITPIICKYSYLKYFKNNQMKNIKKWERISSSASEQCERNSITKILDPVNLKKWIFSLRKEKKIIFTPNIKIINKITLPKKIKKLYILIGSERGFSKKEIKHCIKENFFHINLGKRILRTETASLAAISIMQYKYGDFKNF
jgi:16S rRNA (uracil1498-N3)-methyltransferase